MPRGLALHPRQLSRLVRRMHTHLSKCPDTKRLRCEEALSRLMCRGARAGLKGDQVCELFGVCAEVLDSVAHHEEAA